MAGHACALGQVRASLAERIVLNLAQTERSDAFPWQCLLHPYGKATIRWNGYSRIFIVSNQDSLGSTFLCPNTYYFSLSHLHNNTIVPLSPSYPTIAYKPPQFPTLYLTIIDQTSSDYPVSIHHTNLTSKVTFPHLLPTMPASPYFSNPFSPSSSTTFDPSTSTAFSNYNPCTGHPSTTEPRKRRNAVSQIEMAARIAESTAIPAVEAHERARRRGNRGPYH